MDTHVVDGSQANKCLYLDVIDVAMIISTSDRYPFDAESGGWISVWYRSEVLVVDDWHRTDIHPTLNASAVYRPEVGPLSIWRRHRTDIHPTLNMSAGYRPEVGPMSIWRRKRRLDIGWTSALVSTSDRCPSDAEGVGWISVWHRFVVRPISIWRRKLRMDIGRTSVIVFYCIVTQYLIVFCFHLL